MSSSNRVRRVVGRGAMQAGSNALIRRAGSALLPSILRDHQSNGSPRGDNGSPRGDIGGAINQADLSRLPTLIQGQQLPQISSQMTLGRPDFAAMLSQLQSQSPLGGYTSGPKLQMPQIAPPSPANQRFPQDQNIANLIMGGPPMQMPYDKRLGMTPPYNPNLMRMGLF